MGPPGAGKGTQAKIICSGLGIPQISTGEILRNAMDKGTELGREAKSFVESGALVPDSVVIGIVKERIQEPDCEKGYLLDGFPRTLEQADALKKMTGELGKPLDVALNLAVPQDELVQRLLERARKENRPDDTEPVIKSRLQTYEEQTLPLVDYYRKEGILKEVNGLGSLEEITGRIKEALGI
ncbi:MAG: adenylate kinase [Leptospiraceae bacterium]|nr:adenylate kinase [Leptospiraceae bacterium]MCB1302919.1 adenylate kinase [Leptospiraceae bacterium]